MPALLARFAQLHPRIDVTLQEGDQEQLMTMLLSGRIELALAYDYALTDEVEATRSPCCRPSWSSLRTIAWRANGA